MVTKTQFREKALERFKIAEKFWTNWRADARDDYDFVCGNQWMAEDANKLKNEKRPLITFNYSEKMIDAVVGAEVGNRQEATYRPRDVTDSPLAEIWNSAAKWAREECAAEDEESDAFRDMLICGLGWTLTRISYDEDKDGKLIIERIDPLEMRSDPAAMKVGMSERLYNYRRWWVNVDEAKAEWPDAIFPTVSDVTTDAVGVTIPGQGYNDVSTTEGDADRRKNQVEITHYECIEREPFYRIGIGGQIQEMSVEDFNDVKDHLDETGVPYVKQFKRVYYRGFFAGETLLKMEPSPCQDGFTFQCITGKRDRNKNTWYGLTRVMKDPQRWANKWLSQILHIINSNAKGGLMAEVNAFVDAKKAQEEWAQPDTITLFTEGAVSGGKVQQKQIAQFPAGLDKLMQFALGSLPMVTGINLEALGLANREQAGVLEAQRKQAAYGLLAPLFDALRRYRKSQGRVLLYMIDKYISDGRLIRIGGPDKEQFIPLTKQEGALRYDVTVDQSPNAPDVKQQTWEALMQLVPSLMKAGITPPPDLLDFSPLPTALVTKWKEFAAQNPPPDPRMEQLQQELQKLMEENQALKQDQSIEMAELAMKQKGQQAELAMKLQYMEAELAIKERIEEMEIRMKERELNHKLRLAEMEAEHDARLAEVQEQHQHEAAMKAASQKPAAAAKD